MQTDEPVSGVQFALPWEAKADGKEVTVEGVETYEQYAFLREQGSAELQGYLFSQPKPASAFADPAVLQFAAPMPRKIEVVAASTAAIPISVHQAKGAA